MNPQGPKNDCKPTDKEAETNLLLRKIIAALVMLAATGFFALVVVWPVVKIFVKG